MAAGPAGLKGGENAVSLPQVVEQFRYASLTLLPACHHRPKEDFFECRLHATQSSTHYTSLIMDCDWTKCVVDVYQPGDLCVFQLYGTPCRWDTFYLRTTHANKRQIFGKMVFANIFGLDGQLLTVVPKSSNKKNVFVIQDARSADVAVIERSGNSQLSVCLLDKFTKDSTGDGQVRSYVLSAALRIAVLHYNFTHLNVSEGLKLGTCRIHPSPTCGRIAVQQSMMSNSLSSVLSPYGAVLALHDDYIIKKAARSTNGCQFYMLASADDNCCRYILENWHNKVKVKDAECGTTMYCLEQDGGDRAKYHIYMGTGVKVGFIRGGKVYNVKANLALNAFLPHNDKFDPLCDEPIYVTCATERSPLAVFDFNSVQGFVHLKFVGSVSAVDKSLIVLLVAVRCSNFYRLPDQPAPLVEDHESLCSAVEAAAHSFSLHKSDSLSASRPSLPALKHVHSLKVVPLACAWKGCLHIFLLLNSVSNQLVFLVEIQTHLDGAISFRSLDSRESVIQCTGHLTSPRRSVLIGSRYVGYLEGSNALDADDIKNMSADEAGGEYVSVHSGESAGTVEYDDLNNEVNITLQPDIDDVSKAFILASAMVRANLEYPVWASMPQPIPVFTAELLHKALSQFTPNNDNGEISVRERIASVESVRVVKSACCPLRKEDYVEVRAVDSEDSYLMLIVNHTEEVIELRSPDTLDLICRLTNALDMNGKSLVTDSQAGSIGYVEKLGFFDAQGQEMLKAVGPQKVGDHMDGEKYTVYTLQDEPLCRIEFDEVSNLLRLHFSATYKKRVNLTRCKTLVILFAVKLGYCLFNLSTISAPEKEISSSTESDPEELAILRGAMNVHIVEDKDGRLINVLNGSKLFSFSGDNEGQVLWSIRASTASDVIFSVATTGGDRFTSRWEVYNREKQRLGYIQAYTIYNDIGGSLMCVEVDSYVENIEKKFTITSPSRLVLSEINCQLSTNETEVSFMESTLTTKDKLLVIVMAVQLCCSLASLSDISTTASSYD